MQVEVDRESTRYYLADIFVDWRWVLLGLALVVTVVMIIFVPGAQRDPSLKTMLISDSPSNHQYQEYLKAFGNEEFIIVAIRNQHEAGDPRVLEALASLTRELTQLDKIEEVVSLTDVRVFQKRHELFGAYTLARVESGRLSLPNKPELEKIRDSLPLMDYLVSRDLKTTGILIRVDDCWKFDTNAIKQLLVNIEDLVRKTIPADSEYRIIGQAILRDAIVKYTDRSAVVFGVMCILICAGVTWYIFRSTKVTFLTVLVLGICVFWVLGLMSLMKIPLNPATSMSFGLILVTTLEIVIHIVVRYRQFYDPSKSSIEVGKETVRFLARPLLFGSATTAVGFGTCMVTPVPMVFQLGLIMPVALISSYALAMLLTPSFVMASKSSKDHLRERSPHDILSRVLEAVAACIAKHYRLFTVAGVVVTAIMFLGTPLIRTDPQILRQLGEHSPEVRNIRFVDKNLTAVHALELMLSADDQAFKNPEVWRRVQQLTDHLRQMPEVVATESLFSVLEYVEALVRGSDSRRDDLFTNTALIRELLFLMNHSAQGRRITERYLTEDGDRLRISVRIKNLPEVSILETIDAVRSEAESIMNGVANVTVTGELVVVAMQSKDLIRSEIFSMLLSLALITVLLMIQMGTAQFGLISLIPNIPPIAAVFGIMGWSGMPLNGLTIFAATVAVGLAVDNTIQYVAQLKREIKRNPDQRVEDCVFTAYRLAGRPMASWSIVTALGFLSLLATPFQGARDFGLLVASAVIMGIFGDLIFMQSMILSSSGIRKLIAKIIEKEVSPDQGR